MNTFLLKDITWTHQLIEMTCDNFTSKIRRMLDSVDNTLIENLEDELYLWSIYCELMWFVFSILLLNFNLTQIFQLAILNLMLGSSTSEQSDREFDSKVWELVTIVKKIFETSAKLMSIPPRFADKIHLSVYRDFESAAQRSITLGNLR